jgi:chromosome segregation ATPase
MIQTGVQNLERSILEAQELNKTLQTNLVEWTNANQIVEKAILDAQTLNATLVNNLDQWTASNRQLETAQQQYQNVSDESVTSSQQRVVVTTEDKQVATDLDGDEYASLISQIEYLKGVVDSQKTLIDRHDVEMRETADKFDSMLAIKDQLIDRLETVQVNNQAGKQFDAESEVFENTNSQQQQQLSEQQGSSGGSDEDRVRKLENEYNKLDTAKMQLECDLISARNELDKVRAAVDRADEVKDWTARRAELQAELERLQSDVARAEKECLDSQELYTRLRENIDEWEKSNRSLEEQILGLQEKGASLAENLTSSMAASETGRESSIEREKQELAVKNMDLLVEIDSLKAEKDALVQELDQAKSQNEQLASSQETQELDSSQKTTYFEKKLAQLTEENNLFKTENEELKDRVAHLEREFNESDEKMKLLNHKIESLEGLLREGEELNERLSNEKKAIEATIRDYENRIRVVEQRNSNLNDEVENNSIEKQSLIERIEKLSLEKEKRSRNDGWDSFETVEDSAGKEDEKKETLKKRVDELEAEIKRIESVRQDLQVQNVDLIAELDSVRSEKEELQSELNVAIMNQKESVKSSGADGWDQFESITDESKIDHEAVVRDLENKLSEVESEKQAQEDRIVQLTRDVEEARRQHADLFNQLQAKEDQLREMRDLEKRETVSHVKSAAIESNAGSGGGWDDFEPFDTSANSEQQAASTNDTNNERIAQLVKENEHLKTKIEGLESEIEQLENDLASRPDLSKSSVASDLETELRDQIRNLEAVLESAKQSVQSEREQRTSDMDTLNRERDELSSQLEAKEIELRQLVETHGDEKSQLSIELETMRKTNLDLESRFIELNRRFEESTQSESSRVEELGRELEKQRETENELRETLRSIDETRAQLQVQNIDLLSTVDTLKIEKDQLEQRVSELDALSDLDVKANRTGTSRKDTLVSELERLQVQVKSLEEEILRNQELYNQLGENLVAWQNSNTALEHQIIDLQERNFQLSQRVSDGHDNTKPSELENMFAEKSSQLEQLELKIADLEAQNSEMTSRLTEASASLDVESNKCGELKTEVELLRRERADELFKIDVLNTEVDRLKASNSELTVEIMQMRVSGQDMADINSEMSELREENERLRARIGELETEVDVLNEKLSAEKEHVSHFRSNVSSIMKEYEDEKNTLKAEHAEAEASVKEPKKPGKNFYFNY